MFLTHVDFESVTAQCLFDQSTATTIISANCSTSEVAPDTVIQFVMCQIDGVDTDVCTVILDNYNYIVITKTMLND